MNHTPFWARGKVWGVIAAIAAIAALSLEILATQAVRGATTAYADLIAAANHGDLDAAKRLCSVNYRKSHELQLNQEGGIKGLPRTIHMNYQAWRQAKDVWICPTKQQGPVYRFVKQADGWKFDGVEGFLRRGRVEPPLED